MKYAYVVTDEFGIRAVYGGRGIAIAYAKGHWASQRNWCVPVEVKRWVLGGSAEFSEVIWSKQ